MIVSKWRKAVKYFLDSDYRFSINAGLGFYNYLDDRKYLERLFEARLGYTLNLENPKTYNEKLQWLKLNDRNPEYTQLVDKIAVKSFVTQKIGNRYVIPTYGVWDSANKIDYSLLPDQFVLKCSHDSGSVIICKDKSSFDFQSANRKLTKCLKRNFYYYGREWPYKNIEPRIIAEKYLADGSGDEPRDYKVLCFNGVPKIIEFHRGRFSNHHIQEFYDINWNKLSISQSDANRYYSSSSFSLKPSTLDDMVTLSGVLSNGIPHVRVDWYSIGEKLYFGELTFFDGSGFIKWDNPNDDLMMGSWIDLSLKK